MKKYMSIFRIRFSASLQYRAAALGGIATQFAWGFMELLAFSALYRTNPDAFPMEFSQTVSYIWIQQAFLSIFFAWFYENDIFNAISSGSIAYELVRPIDLYNRWFFQGAATRLAKALLRCFPILFVAAVVPEPYRLSLPDSPFQFLMFVLSSVLSLCVVLSLNMLVYVSAFYTVSSLGMRIITGTLADFLAGSIVPLPFFPDAVRKIAELLPFAAMQNMPLRIYVGNLTGLDALRGMMLQLFWLTVMVNAGRFAMKRAQRKVIIQGG